MQKGCLPDHVPLGKQILSAEPYRVCPTAQVKRTLLRTLKFPASLLAWAGVPGSPQAPAESPAAQIDKRRWKQMKMPCARLCVLPDGSLWAGMAVNYTTVFLSSRGTTRGGRMSELFIFHVFREAAIKHDAPVNSCHQANNLQDQCFSLPWHQERSGHKSSGPSIKRQPAVVMRNDEYSLTSEVKCVFIIVNYLRLLFCGGAHSRTPPVLRVYELTQVQGCCASRTVHLVTSPIGLQRARGWEPAPSRGSTTQRVLLLWWAAS